jgi:hypothetical protein
MHLLRALPKEMLRALDKFVRSPYLVTHSGVLQLFEQWRADDKALDAKQARSQSADPEGDGPSRLYHLSNYLQEAAENFLALELWKQQPHLRNLQVAEACRHFGLDADTTAGMLRYARRRLEADPQRGSDYHRADHALYLEAYLASLQQGRSKSFNLQQLSDSQDIAFLCEKLRTGCMLLSHQAVARTEYQPGMLPTVLDFLRDHPYLQVPAVAAYYHGYYAQAGGEGSDEHFRYLKILLDAHAAQFSTAEVHDLYLMAVNFCIRRINKSEETYFRQLFELYQSGLRHGALLEGGLLSRWTYTNITATALYLREFDWTERFLHDFAPKLAENHREGTFHYNFARYCYDRRQLREAMQHLVRREYDDVLQNLMAKMMLCKIYYELDEHNALDNQLDSIQIYLRRKKVLGYHRDNALNTVRYFRRLVALNFMDTAAVERFRSDVAAESMLMERDWFLKTLDGLR